MSLRFDLTYAWRLLVKSWAYSLMCAAVVALSVGLSVFMYTVAYSQFYKPLEYPHSQRWFSVQIAARAGATARPTVDAYTYQELLKQNHSAEYLGAYSKRVAVLSDGQASASLRAADISPGLLAATHVAPLLGRVFQEADGGPGAAPVAIISFETWQKYFAADPGVVGRTTQIGSAPVQIIGVMPKTFYAFQDFELWLPLHMPNLARPQDSTLVVSPFITLHENQDGATLASEMNAVVERVNGDHPDVYGSTRHVELFPAHRMFSHAFVSIVAMLSLIVAAVTLLGSVNIGMVFLARLLERSRELALRNALGASRSRLFRQVLLEMALIIPLGLVAGYGLAAALIRWLQGLSNFSAQVLASGRDPNELALRPVDLVVAVLAALAIWLLSTLVPSWRIARQDAAAVLAGSGKGPTAGTGNKTVRMLVGLQVAISSIVLVVCGNIVTAVSREAGKPTGLHTAQVVLSTSPTVFSAKYSEATQRQRYWDDLTAAAQRDNPGAQVAFATAVPTMPVSVPAAIETQQGTGGQGTLTVPVAAVSDDYFNLLGMKLRSGRLLDTTDTSASLAVAVVDEKMVERYWPGQDVLGKRVKLNPSDGGQSLTIVGVVSSVTAGPYRPDVGILYQSLRQSAPSEFLVLAKAPSGARDGRSALRAAAFKVDPELPLHNLQTLDDYLTAVNQRFGALRAVLTGAAIITLILAATGLFGLISRLVAQRTQEVGIRRSLGATPWRATSMFVRQGMVYLGVAVIGVLAGIGVMPLLSRAIPNILVLVAPVTLCVVLVMALVIFSASYLPTRRAVALEPGDALRYE